VNDYHFLTDDEPLMKKKVLEICVQHQTVIWWS